MTKLKPVTLSLAALIAATAALAETLKKEPRMGALREGETVFVDDGSCPKGQVKRVTGGNHIKAGGTKALERIRVCVPR